MDIAPMDLPSLYRRLIDPRARRTASTAIVHSGGKQTVFGCVCGSRHTTATRYRGWTRHEQDWHAAHGGCLARAVAAALPGSLACFAPAEVLS